VTVPERATTVAAHLARTGFDDPTTAEHTLDLLGVGADDADLIEALARTADPDLALATLLRLAVVAGPQGWDELVTALRQHDGLRRRLLAVMGASSALGDALVRRPADWRVLDDDAAAASRPSRYGL
jgi:[glutamine synthetase] adenylyltransferase / [glutamine synthetase]-adenylyl-L-tyrosine phosphorylase